MTAAIGADRQRGVRASVRRIRALIMRHAFLLVKSWPRLVSMAYYPTVTMVLWAFVTLYLAPTNRFLADALGLFIGAVLLWDVLFRGQLGVSLTFIEEMYSRNLGNLFVSPLRLYELIIGQLAMSVMRTLIGVGGACFFAWLLFRYSIFSMGLPLIAFFACLLAFGWAIGLAVSAMILRYGLGGDLSRSNRVGGLLPDRRIAAGAAVDQPRAAAGARLRGHAGRVAAEDLSLRPAGERAAARCGLRSDRLRAVRACRAVGAQARRVAADGRIGRDSARMIPPRSRLRPALNQLRVARGEPRDLERRSVPLLDGMQRARHFEQQRPLFRIADEALYPEYDAKPHAAGHRRDVM